MNLEALINTHYSKLNETDLQILEYVLKNKETSGHLTIVQLAKATLTSKSTISRLAQKLGFSGFTEFKYRLQDTNTKEIEQSSPYMIDLELTNNQLTDIQATHKLFSQMYNEASIKAIFDAKRIFCFGTGWGQRNIISDFIRNMQSIGVFPIEVKSTFEFRKTIKQDVTSDDIIIVVSLSGDITRIESELTYALVTGVKTISITELSNNYLSALSAYNLYFQASRQEVQGKEFISFVTMHLVMDSFFRKIIQYQLD